MGKDAERKFILEFISVYRSLPALWDVKCKDYTNRVKKNEQYELLVDKYREIAPHADKPEVIKKINSLRTNFRKQLKKVREPSDSDAEPSLWYFDEMKFLLNQEAPSSMNLSFQEKEDEENDWQIYSSESIVKLEPPLKKVKRDAIKSEEVEIACKPIPKTIQKPPDDYETIAAAWSVELKQMEPTQQIFAKKFINEILFEGQMGTLHRDSVLINHQCSLHSRFT